MSIFDELMLARQLKFTNGKIELLGQPLVFSPANFWSKYIFELKDNTEQIRQLYLSAKDTMKEGFSYNVGSSFGFSFKDYMKWFIDIAGLSGWGEFEWADMDETKKQGVITIKGSPVALELKNKVTEPCDHITRGFVAGAASSAFKDDIDIIEIECEAVGAEKCKLIMQKSDDIRLNFPEIAKKQV
jgi:predicted hydrocarbon binding protein